MFDKARARKAFEGCSNRSIVPIHDRHANELTCPKYPEGRWLGENLVYRDGRSSVAMKLGCLGCRFAQAEGGQVSVEVSVMPDGTVSTIRQFSFENDENRTLPQDPES